MKTDLDALLRDSDPGHLMAILAAESPEFERIWAQISKDQIDTAASPHRRTRRILVPIVSLGLVVAILLLVAVLWPTAGFRGGPSAAATLRSLARAAGTQPSTVPTDNQWLEQEVQVSFNASILTVGSTSTPNASATVNANINEWSNTKSTTCTQSIFSAAQFASPANQQAWLAAGLLVNPISPSVSCTTVSGPQSSAVGGGTGAFDISSLSTDPATLAQELEAGTTGITGLDQLPSSEVGANPGFGRAAALLVGPTVGASPPFWSALLNAMATMKGVSALGDVLTHSGTTGLGFMAQAGLTQITIVLSPSTGALLEARNFQDVALQGSGSAFVNGADPDGIASQGGSTKSVFAWLDPLTSPTVVNSLPNSVQRQLPRVSATTGFIQAETHPGVTVAQLTSLQRQIRELPGAPLPGYSSVGIPPVWIFTVAMHGTNSDEDRVVVVMRQSGLFAYVNKNSG
jgi:hypothetical protein